MLVKWDPRGLIWWLLDNPKIDCVCLLSDHACCTIITYNVDNYVPNLVLLMVFRFNYVSACFNGVSVHLVEKNSQYGNDGGGCMWVVGWWWWSAVVWSVIEMLARINLPKPKTNMLKLEPNLSDTKRYKFWISFCNSQTKIHCILMLWHKTHICLWIKPHFVYVFRSWLNIYWFYFILIALLIKIEIQVEAILLKKELMEPERWVKQCTPLTIRYRNSTRGGTFDVKLEGNCQQVERLLRRGPWSILIRT